MSNHSDTNPPSAADAIREALANVEKLHAEEKFQQSTSDIDADDVEVIRPQAQDDEDDAAANTSAETVIDVQADVGNLDDKRAAAQKRNQEMMLAALIAAKNEAIKERDDAVVASDAARKEMTEMRERWMRAQADFDNYKKRQQREMQEQVKYSNEKLLRDLIPVVDNLERAVAASQAAGETGQLAGGVKLVLKQFEDTLARFGVVAFSALGQRFDPAKHEAVSSREDVSVPAQTVVEEYQRGYLLNERLVRPSMVVVAVGGDEGPAESASDPNVQ